MAGAAHTNLGTMPGNNLARFQQARVYFTLWQELFHTMGYYKVLRRLPISY